MCASYGALESTFVSTRSTVPDTLARAAARTLAAASPLSSVSVLPLTVWPPCDGSRGGCPLGAWSADGDDEDDAFEDVAALAIAPPPTAAAPIAAAVTSLVRILDIGSPLGRGTKQRPRSPVVPRADPEQAGNSPRKRSSATPALQVADCAGARRGPSAWSSRR